MRIINRIAATLLALVLIAGGLLVVVQTVTALLDRPWPIPASWREDLRAVTVDDTRVLWTCVGVAAFGLIALVAQLVPRRQRQLPAGGGETPWWLSRRAAERRTTRAAQRAGVSARASTTVRGDAQQWRVQVSGEAPNHKHAGVERAVRDELISLGAPAELTVASSLRQARHVS